MNRYYSIFILGFALGTAALAASATTQSVRDQHARTWTDTCFTYGDINSNGTPLENSDLLYLGLYLFQGGQRPVQFMSADLNGDCVVDTLDFLVFQCYLENGMSCFEAYPVPTCCMDCITVGDVDSNGIILTIDDLDYLIAFLDSNGPAPKPLYAGDLNGDCQVDSLDVERYQCYFQQGLPCLPVFPVPTCCELIYYASGDADGNGLITISDAIYIIQYIFNGGPAPNPIQTADADCNTLVTISDAVYLISYIFAGGAAPCAL